MRKVLFILVIYQKALAESQAYQSLAGLLDDATLRDCLYVHDNTACNQYLAVAYNHGAAVARERNKQWIVLLDDDTHITQEYLQQLQVYLSDKHQVLAPQLVHQGKQVSPIIQYGIRVVFNSAMAIRLQTLQEIGGFCTRYPLDYLDYYTCWQLHEHDIPITVMDVVLPHQLSVEDYTHVPPERYASILRAEKQFAYDTGHNIRYRLQLLARVIKWWLTGHKYVRETIKAIWK